MRASLVFAVAAGAGLLLAACRVQRARRRAPPLPPAGPGPTVAPPAGPEVAVLLPVRDEEDDLLPCVESLLAQTLRLPVVVVDDGSSDRTLELARRRAAGEPRLAVVEAGPLPAGWGGKVHALDVGHRHLAARAAGPPRWLLATDADTRHHPELLARALAAAEGRGLDLVSVAGHQRVAGVAENLLTPAVFALLDALLGDWEAAASGGGPPVANGQFLLVREAALAAVGGFGSLRGAAIDDVTLARRLREGGFTTGFLRAPDLLAVRMYRGGRATFQGWRRNLGGLFGGRPRRLAAMALVAGAPALLVAGFLAAGLLPEAAVVWAAGVAASAALRRGAGHPAAGALLHPCDGLALAATLLLGAADWRRGRLAPWKGRPVRV